MKPRRNGERLGVSLLVLVATVVSCEGGGDSSDGSTNWLKPCDATADCNSEYRCVCGVCTLLCSSGADCSALPGHAVCVESKADLERACRFGFGVSPSEAACFPPCVGDGECSDGLACRAGLCVPDRSVTDGGPPVGWDASVDAAAPPVMPLARPADRPDPQAFADVDVPVSFEEPVVLPPPDRTISGDASAMVGAWVEVDFEGVTCDPNTAESMSTGRTCTYLEIRRDTEGRYVGGLYQESSRSQFSSFPPPVDPTVGYPEGIPAEEYPDLRRLTRGVRYQVLDGTVRDDTLSFFVSPLDLWQEWCAMQTPYHWDLGDRYAYRCVPQSATLADTDPGKLGLCTSRDDLDQCTYSDGTSGPCVCTGDGGSSHPQCSDLFCVCSETGCQADTRATSSSGSLALEGQRLVGSFAFEHTFGGTLEMVRVAP